jgi:hypothetical protein
LFILNLKIPGGPDIPGGPGGPSIETPTIENVALFI